MYSKLQIRYILKSSWKVVYKDVKISCRCLQKCQVIGLENRVNVSLLGKGILEGNKTWRLWPSGDATSVRVHRLFMHCWWFFLKYFSSILTWPLIFLQAAADNFYFFVTQLFKSFSKIYLICNLEYTRSDASLVSNKSYFDSLPQFNIPESNPDAGNE